MCLLHAPSTSCQAETTEGVRDIIIASIAPLRGCVAVLDGVWVIAWRWIWRKQERRQIAMKKRVHLRRHSGT